MRNTKLQSILALSLTLVVGFACGFATSSFLPETRTKTEQLPDISFQHVPARMPVWPTTGYFSDFAYPASAISGFNSAFDELLKATFHPIGLPRPLFGDSQFTLAASPSIDFKQTKDDIQLVLSTPGLKPEDVTVSLEGNKLIVRGHHKEQSANGFREQTFTRTIDVPYGIDLSRVRKHAANGSVTVTVPRSILSAAELPV